jgi:hypothetical protein
MDSMSFILKANTSFQLQNKMNWYSSQYPKNDYDTKFGAPFTSKDGMSCVKVTRLKEKKSPTSENLTNPKPYIDIEVTDKYIIREFNENIDPIELLWHRDNEERIVEIIGETDWKIQLDEELPNSLNKPILIPKHHWHRLIKGNGNLRLKIHKL